MQNDSFLQQALFFGSHHKVVRVILVVDDVFQVNTYKVQKTDLLSHTKHNRFLIAKAGCHIVIRGTIMRLRAHNQSPEEIITSAINCGGLGIRPNVKHFNWMIREI